MPQTLVSPVQQRFASLYQSTKNGAVGIGANQAAATLSVGLAATYTGLCLSNPAGSGKNLVLLHIGGLLSAVPSAATGLLLITGYAAAGVTVHTTPLVARNALLSSALPLVGLVDAAATLVGTPAFSRALSATPSATGQTAFSTPVEGAIIIPPGGYAAIGSITAQPGFLGSFLWDEEPV